MTQADDIIDALRNLRDSQGLTIGELSKLAGYNRTQIARAENHKIRVSFGQVCDVASALGYELLLVPKKD